jgi:hypothetical protein
MHKAAWIACRRNQVVPPACRDPRRLELQDPISQRIALVVIEEQPPVERLFIEQSLNLPYG